MGYTSDVYRLGRLRQPSAPARRAYHEGYSDAVADDHRAKRARRRYEIARDVMAAIYGSPDWHNDAGEPFDTADAAEHARHAVAAADALLEALDAVDQG